MKHQSSIVKKLRSWSQDTELPLKLGIQKEYQGANIKQKLLHVPNERIRDCLNWRDDWWTLIFVDHILFYFIIILLSCF